MAQRPNVPKFGNWDSEEKAPNYTIYFDKAREGRGGGKMINPNDPQENPDMFPPAHSNENNTGRRAAGGGDQSANQRGRGAGGSSRPVRPVSAGSDHSIDRAPLHPQQQGKNSYDSSGAPGKSRMRPRGDETPDRSPAVPKFGEWDENNPSSAEGYTGIFNRVIEERHNGGKSPGVSNEPSYATARKLDTDDDVKCCCFQWGRK